jgi:hypothetical protein
MPLFRWTWEAPDAWQQALQRLAPPQDRSSHLHLLWGAGTPLEPVQRWVIYQAIPALYLTPGRLGAFLDFAPCRCPTTPLELAGWDVPCGRCGRRPDAERQKVLEYFFQTGCLSAPFWVIQGRDGGHKWRYNSADAMAARFVGRPDTAPEAGTLPYAPFDNRVLQKIRLTDQCQRAERDFATADANSRRDAEEAFRMLMLRAYTHEAEDTAKDLWRAFADVPVIHGETRYDQLDDDAIDEAYVTTGDVNALL